MPIGVSDFKAATTSYYYVDKTLLIRDFLDTKPMVSLFTRPRRFGKTMNMDMLRVFFEKTAEDTSIYFRDKQIWQCGDFYTQHQGQYPVIFLTFKDVKCLTWEETYQKIRILISLEFMRHSELETSQTLTTYEKEQYHRFASDKVTEVDCQMGLQLLSLLLHKHFGKECVIIIDEYDTPIQEAYVGGFWSDLMGVLRSLLNSTFKTNPYLERAIMTGITRVSKESIFSDLNNLEVVTTTSKKYEDKFGFTQEEVIKALKEYDLEDKKEEVKLWYDGFCFGEAKEIYNPWSIINYLDKKEVAPYWANTSSNSLIGKLIREGNTQVKESFELLLNGKEIVTELDEQIVYDQLDLEETAIWSLLLASGYLKVEEKIRDDSDYLNWKQLYRLKLTNFEVKVMFAHMVKNWFSKTGGDYNAFIKAMLNDESKIKQSLWNLK